MGVVDDQYVVHYGIPSLGGLLNSVMCILLGKTCGHSMFLACIDFCMSESTYSKSHMGSAHSILNILSVHG